MTEWDPQAAFLAWVAEDQARLLAAAALSETSPEFLDDLGSEVLPAVLEVLAFVGNRGAPMAEVERIARLPRDRSRLVLEQVGYYVVRFMFDRVPPHEVASVAEVLGWLALIGREGGHHA